MKKLFANKKLLIIVICALAVLIAAGVTTAVLLLTGDTQETSSAMSDNKIHWNVDRQLYYGQGEGGNSSRAIDKDDGYYHITLATEGRPIERKAKKMPVVNKIDSYDAMGIVIDQKTREITDVVPIEDMGAYFLCNKVYVDQINGTELKLNSSTSFMGEEITVKLKATTPIYDVSLQALSDKGMPTKLETVEHKDQVSVICNKDGSIYAVYVTKRSKTTPIYWNVKRMYDSKMMKTTRQPDENGIYHILMAVRGQQVDVLCKDENEVTKIDSRANRSCGLEFDEEGYVINSITATQCTGGKSVASWFDVMSLDGNTFFAEKHSTTAKDNGKQVTLTMDPDCEVYNVSDNHEKFVGEVTELQLNDRVQGFTDPSGKVVVLFIVGRFVKGDLYWNAYRMWDSNNSVSSRTLEDDGYYHAIVCRDGTAKDIKLANKAIADQFDGVASRSIGIRFEKDVAVEIISPGKMYYSVASWYQATEIKDPKTIHFKKMDGSGKECDANLSDDCQVLDVSEAYKDHLGEYTTLRVGDQIQGWSDSTGKTKFVFVIAHKADNPLTAHKGNHICKDCGENVQWTPWTSSSKLPTTSGHYYLCGNVVAPQANVAQDQNVVLCLNGYTVCAAGKRIYANYEKNSHLTIHDCVGTGKMMSRYLGGLGTTQGVIFWVRYGTLKLFGGTYQAPTVPTNNVGPVITSQSDTEVTIKDATIIGGPTKKDGGAIYIGAGGATILSLENTTIIPGKSATGRGNSVFMLKNAKLNLAGKVNMSGSGGNDLHFGSGAVINFDKNNPFCCDGKISVETETASGKSTSNYIDGAENYFVSTDPSIDLNVVPGSYLFLGRNHSVTAHKVSHKCEDCGEDVEWTPWTSMSTLPVSSGHYYLCGDVTTGQNDMLANQKVVLCLNGYTVKGNGNRVYSMNNNGVALTVCDCTGSGKMYNGKTSGNLSTTQGGVIWAPKGTLKIFGGTYEATTALLPGNGSVFCLDSAANHIIKNATVKGGPTQRNGGAICVGNSKGTLTLENTTVIPGSAATGKGNAIYVAAGAKLNLANKVNIQSSGGNDLYLCAEARVNFDTEKPFTSDSKISTSTESGNGRISQNYITGTENYFASTDPSCAVKTVLKSYLQIGKEYPVTPHRNTHTCEECGKDVEWTPWTSASTLPVESGHYYLCGDVTTEQNNVGTNQNVVLCLNGYTVKGSNNRIYGITGDGMKLSITDCVGTGKMYNGKTSGSFGTTQGSVIWVQKGILNIFGGTYQATTAEIPGNGAAICIDAGTTNTIKNATIIGGPTAKNGGAIYAGNEKTVLNLDNTTVISGKAATGKGNGIYMAAKSKLYLTGKINISGSGSNDLYLGADALINFKTEKPLLDGSKIVAATDTASGRITQNYVTGAEKYFVNADPTGSVNVVLTYIQLGKNHEVTEHRTTHTCEECGKSDVWQPWTSASTLPTKSGHYYLCGDVYTDQNTVEVDQNVVLCLNGYTVKGYGNRIYSLNNNNVALTMCDCVGTGKMYNSKTGTNFSTTQGGVVWVPKGTLKIFGGTYQATTAKIPGNGSVFSLDSAAEHIIKNATIIGGPTAAGGGAIYVSKGTATLTLEDTTVISGKADTGKGNGIYMAAGSKLNLAGKINISGSGSNDLYLGAGALINLSTEKPLTSPDSKVVVDSASTDGKITENYTAEAEKCFVTAAPNYAVDVVSNSYIRLIGVHKENHKCDDCGKDVQWTAWTSATTLPTESGHYYLSVDVTTGQNNIAANQNVVLCLNGHTVKGTGNRIYSLNVTNPALTICDCVGTGKMYNSKTGTNFSTTQGGVVWVPKGTLKIFGGTYQATTAKIPGNGSVFCFDSKTEHIIKNATIIGGPTAKSGGAIYAAANVKLRLEDVNITSGKTDTGLGDAVYINENAALTLAGKINITGGTNQMYLNTGAYITFDGALTEGSEFGVLSADEDGKISTNYTEDAEKYVKSEKSGYIVVKKDDALYYEAAPLKSTVGAASPSKLSIFSPLFNLLRKVGL